MDIQPQPVDTFPGLQGKGLHLGARYAVGAHGGQMPDGVSRVGDGVVAQASIEDIHRVESGLVQGSRGIEVHFASNSVVYTLIIVYYLHYVKRLSKSLLVVWSQ
jgi:hypothetical protein